ncbi:ATP-dependent DNA helicase DinG [Listeria costaricensis]|uniref:ATP-dependent DNA helicase DinG n=1 Tax=Listeria costaricensis TaxID=2026604 RepID=UPI000C07D46E|nr:ATP-dependent DNA helicase DinG [Listeria costaricensis]
MKKTKRYLVVDLETTGNQAGRKDRIIQFAGVLVENGRIEHTYSTFINPLKKIPPFIQELTGISDQDVKEAPHFEDVAPIILSLLEDTIFVAHNVAFDWTFLEKELKMAGEKVPRIQKLDTVELTRILYPGIDSYKLQDLGDEFGFGHDRPHQADSDAYVTAELLLLCLEKLNGLPLPVLRKMSNIAQPLKNHLPELLFEVEMAQDRKNLPLSEELLLRRGLVIRKKQVCPSEKMDPGAFPVQAAEKEALFKRAGAPLFARTGQFEMMDLVYQAMQEKRHALIEAGTGIGKSLGYFLPSLYFAKEKQLPVIISTYTNLLQSQLYQKDVRLAQKLSGLPVSTTLLKGRDHYLNLFKFEKVLEERDPTYDVVVTKLKLLVWLTETETGDIDEVNLSSGGRLFWNRMKHTGWYLSEKRDPWLPYDFYKFNLEQAKQADLVIVNHALLLKDHFDSRKLLPEYAYAVIDEAHHFAESARSQGSFRLSYRKLKYFMNQLGTLERYSLLSRLDLVFPSDERLFDLDIAALKLPEAVEAFFAALQKQLVSSRKERTEMALLMSSQSDEWGEELYYLAENLLALLQEVCLHLRALLEKGKSEQETLKEGETAFIEEVFAFLLDFEELASGLDQLVHQKLPVETIIIEADKNCSLSSVALKGILLQVEELLEDEFFGKKESVIMTSATLTVADSFRYTKQSLGLSEADLIEARIPSPFDYAANSRVFIPDDLPPIKGTPLEVYTRVLTDYLKEIALRTNGRMLVLFTAADMLRQTAVRMKDAPELADYIVLAQGLSSGSSARLTKQFQLFDKAILLGLSSFWEGIDIPGEDLSCLVIVRLPFAPPDDPFTKAQIALKKANGENAFQNLSLPEAVLRFKQGFGRLIRREDDRGVVFVFDNRVDTTRFGKTFLQSLPPVEIEKGPRDELLSRVSQFFAEDHD